MKQTAIQQPTKSPFANAKALLTKREKIQAIILEAQEELDRINGELENFLGNKTRETIRMDDSYYTITRATRLSFKEVDLEIAKKFRAIKKVVDPDVLKPLYLKGVKIPNVVEYEYVTVRKSKDLPK